MRAQGCCCVACVLLIRWLAQLFDLDYEKVSNKASWSLLLEVVAQRLEADMEPELSAEFPWPLSHLSVLSVLRRGDWSVLCRPVVEHLCCEAYKIAHGAGRLALRASIYVVASVCRFSGDLRFECDRIPYADLLASVYHRFP